MENINEVKKRGRPKKIILEEETINKVRGRPRLYDHENTELMKEIKTKTNKKYYESRGYYTNKIKYYIQHYKVDVTREDFIDKTIEELKNILTKIQNKINEIKSKNIEHKIIQKQNILKSKIKKKEEKLLEKQEYYNIKEEERLNKIKEQRKKIEQKQNIKQENIMNQIQKIKQEEYKKLHELLIKQIQNKSQKQRQIKMRIID